MVEIGFCLPPYCFLRPLTRKNRRKRSKRRMRRMSRKMKQPHRKRFSVSASEAGPPLRAQREKLRRAP